MGRLFFYGFADEQEKSLIAWRLCDLKAFRLWFMRQLFLNKGEMPGFEKLNGDGSSKFRTFQITNINNFLKASVNG